MARFERLRSWWKRTFNKENARKPMFWVICAGILGAVIIVVGSVLWVTEQPFFCNSCHIMNAPYKTWSKSTHANVRCTQCHVKPGFIAMIEHKPQGLKELWSVITKNPSKPSEVHPPDNVNCELCHKSKRKVSSTGDLLIPHEQHTKLRGLKCVDCHRWLVHKQGTAGSRNRPPMIVCYKCHDGKKAPNRCTTCHTEKNVPENHLTAEWPATHAEVQKQDPAYCEKCHGWVKDYCTECHQRRPKSHDTKWRSNHRTIVAERGKAGCMFCHKDEFCVRCHGLIP